MRHNNDDDVGTTHPIYSQSRNTAAADFIIMLILLMDENVAIPTIILRVLFIIGYLEDTPKMRV